MSDNTIIKQLAIAVVKSHSYCDIFGDKHCEHCLTNLFYDPHDDDCIVHLAEEELKRIAYWAWRDGTPV